MSIRQYTIDNGLTVRETAGQALKDVESKASTYAQSEEVSKTNFELNGVRLLKVNEKIKKCECAAELVVNDHNTLDLEHTTQYTEYRQVYVEVPLKI